MGKKRSVVLPRSPEALDLVSYGRRGGGIPGRFDRDQMAQIARTVRRVPEVMVKVSGGGREAGAVQAHFSYMGRQGKLEIETDDGRVLSGKGAAKALVEDWDLDLSAGPYRAGRALKHHIPPKAPKDAHNIVLSMPSATPPDKLLAAAKAFAVNQFGGRHRYAMVLHTDQKHPHVHLIVKAKSEQGKRLYIRKETLREWREDFAKELRARGIAANATTRAVRGQTKSSKRTPIHRAAMRGKSTFMETLVRDVGNAIKVGKLFPGSGKPKVLKTRAEALEQWDQTAKRLEQQGESKLAEEVRQFTKTMPPPRTDRERIAAGILTEIARRRRPSPDTTRDRGKPRGTTTTPDRAPPERER